MGKKNKKNNKGKPVDNNYPTSSKTEIVKKPNESLNTFGESSVTENSRANECINSSLIQKKEKLVSSHKIKGILYKTQKRNADHNSSKGKTLFFNQGKLKSNECNSDSMTTREFSDTSSFQNVTLDSQNVFQDSNQYSRKENHDVSEKCVTELSYYVNYRSFGCDRIRDENFPSKTSDNKYFNKSEKHSYAVNHNKHENKNVTDEKYSKPEVGKENSENPEILVDSFMSTELEGFEKKESKYKITCNNFPGFPGPWKETFEKVSIPSFKSETYSKASHLENEEESWDDDVHSEINQYETMQRADVIKAAYIEKPTIHTFNSYCSLEENLRGFELNANAKTFTPIQLGQKKLENVESEVCQSKYNITLDNSDYFYNNCQNKSREGQQRKCVSLGGQNRCEKADHRRNWRENGPNRYSEGRNLTNKRNSSFLKPSSWGDAKVTSESRESSEHTDVEYGKFQDTEKNNTNIEFVRVSEIQQDLFAMAKEYSLAHCVAEDMKMGNGIAVSFKRNFEAVDDLLNQRQKQGGLAVLEDKTQDDHRYIYYLVTKHVSNGKPTYETLWSSLKKMREHIIEYDIKKLAIPRLGCGLDRLEWRTVKNMIEFLFKDVQIEITVCNFQQTEDSPEKLLNKTCRVVHVKKPVAEIESETTIIYFSTENGDISTEMEQLNKHFSFLAEFKKAQKPLGYPIKYDIPKKFYILYGCIVRSTNNDPFDFVSFRKCISQIDKNNKKDGYVYIAIQAIKDASDDLINDKIITLLKNYLHKVDIYVCWDGDLVQQMPILNKE